MGGESPKESDPEGLRHQRIEELCGGTPEVLYILSGSLVKAEPLKGTETPRYKEGSYRDVDIHDLLNGGKARVIAAAEIADHFPETRVVTNSRTLREGPSDAAVMAEDLEVRYGIDPERVIIIQDQSYSTITEMIALIKMVVAKGWKKVAIVTNEFQIPRAGEILKQIESLTSAPTAPKDPEFEVALRELKELSPQITFVSAEDILPIRDNRYGRIIEDAKASEGWKKRIAAEARGLQDLKEGRYKYTSPNVRK